MKNDMNEGKFICRSRALKDHNKRTDHENACDKDYNKYKNDPKWIEHFSKVNLLYVGDVLLPKQKSVFFASSFVASAIKQNVSLYSIHKLCKRLGKGLQIIDPTFVFDMAGYEDEQYIVNEIISVLHNVYEDNVL
jgi:3-methyladenine DNA glycosylase/8-oxoguanine DNA glycosylase